MGCPKFIKRICQSRLDHNISVPLLRSNLYVNSAEVFQISQEDSKKDRLEEIATKYAHVLKEQVNKAGQYYGPAATKEREIYQRLERLWTLCEILYFSSSHKEDSAALMNWFSKSYRPYLLEYDRQDIFYCKSTFEHADFWPYAIRLVLSGQLDQLSKLISHALENDKTQNRYSSLSTLTHLHGLISQGLPHLKSQHQTIQNMLKSLKQPSHHTKHVIDILNLLMGDEIVTLKYAKDDIHAFISCNYYSNKITYNTVFQLAQEFLKKHTQKQGDQSIRFFLQGEIFNGIEATVHEDWWFLAHLSDLLHAKKLLDRVVNFNLDNESTVSLDAREYFVLTYASYLFNQFGLWKEAFTYLLTCKEFGKSAVIEHLSTMNFQNEDEKLHDVVKFCFDYSMKNEGLILYERKAKDCLELKEYRKALQFYTRAEKEDYLDKVFYAVLEDFAHTGVLYDFSLFSETAKGLQGIHFIIYKAISEISALFLDQQFESAAATFVSLLKQDGIPKKLMPIIFAQGWKLVNRQVGFTFDDLLYMKKAWKRVKNTSSSQDFEWYHYYIAKDKSRSDDLTKDMLEFLDTTAIIIARAIDKCEKDD